jgi:hypothetical protein
LKITGFTHYPEHIAESKDEVNYEFGLETDIDPI